MYDPVMGRMLSPDNYVSLPEHTQGYNRYTYALNNPLIITDPSGDNPVLLFIAFAGVLNGTMSAQNGDGFLQGFATGVATGALSAGVGAAIGPVVQGSKIGAHIANAGIHTAIAGGITYGTDALVNNTAFNWKAYGLNVATSMGLAGLSYQKPGGQYTYYSREDLEAAGLQFNLGRRYGMRFPDPPDWTWGKNERGAVLNIPGPEIVSGSAGGGDLLNGIVTVGFTGTLSAGFLGGSFELGIAFDGKDYSFYGTLEHSVGADLSLGGVVNYHSPHKGNLSFSEAEGWSESINGAAWIIDGTYGGNSLNSGLDPKNYSDYHTLYNTYGFGVSGGLPVGFTVNKGYTWYFLKF
jgi:hypothetical protein